MIIREQHEFELGAFSFLGFVVGLGRQVVDYRGKMLNQIV